MKQPFRRRPGGLPIGMVVLGTLGALALSACGIPTDDGAAGEDFPPELLEPLPVTTSTTVLSVEGDGVRLRLYFHTDNGQLFRVYRSFPSSPTIDVALGYLMAGPNEEELSMASPTFIQLTLPVSLDPVVTRIEDGAAYIRVSDAAQFRNLPDRRTAVAELVCTSVQYRRVDRVVMLDSQGEIPLTDMEANSIDGPANASHFNNCEPAPSPPPTTVPTQGVTDDADDD